MKIHSNVGCVGTNVKHNYRINCFAERSRATCLPVMEEESRAKITTAICKGNVVTFDILSKWNSGWFAVKIIFCIFFHFILFDLSLDFNFTLLKNGQPFFVFALPGVHFRIFIAIVFQSMWHSHTNVCESKFNITVQHYTTLHFIQTSPGFKLKKLPSWSANRPTSRPRLWLWDSGGTEL